MADDPCKDCINHAEPREPAPMPVSPADLAHSFDALRRELDVPRDGVVLAEALTLLRWAIAESRRGRFILSGDPDSGTLERLIMAALERVFRRGPPE